MTVKEIYQKILTKMRNLGKTSDEFHVKIDVHQGSAFSPLPFNIVMNHRKSATSASIGYLICGRRIIISQEVNDLQQISKKVEEEDDLSRIFGCIRSASKQREDRADALQL